MFLDDIDMKILSENFDNEMISKIDSNNVLRIFKYLENNGVYYAEDLFLNSLNIFLFSYEDFVKKFEKLKIRLGLDFVDKLGNDMSLIEIMYEF